MVESSNEKEIWQALEGRPVLIYGAHLVAIELYRYLHAVLASMDFAGFVVTRAADNPSELEGEKVTELRFCLADKDAVVILAMPEKYHNEVEAYARKFGFSSFLKIGLAEMAYLKGKKLLHDYKKIKNQRFHLYWDKYDASWLNISETFDETVQKKDIDKKHCKFPTLYYLDSQNVFAELERFDFSATYKRVWGEYHNLHTFPTGDCIYDKKQIEKLLNVYMVFSQWDSAKPSKKKFPPWIYPIQAGSILAKKKVGTYLDETGDSISQKNGVFAEMTAAYWIWKNAMPVKYKGLCHYRRHFVLTEAEVLSLETNSIDVILTTPRYAPGGIKRMFLAETPVKEPVYQAMLKAVVMCHPEEKSSLEEYMEMCLYCPNNMVIARSEVYDAYCEWIFPVLFRMMEIEEENNYGHEKDRHIAYAAELLTSYFFVKNKEKYRIAITDYALYSENENNMKREFIV